MKMEKQAKIEELVELLFSQCEFDSFYMDEEFRKQQFRTALQDDEVFRYILSKAKVGKL